MTITADAKARGRRIFQSIRDQKRGWTINWKALGVAYIVEIGVIISGFAAGLSFANKYATDGIDGVATLQTAGIGTAAWQIPMWTDHSAAWKMAMIATIAFCLAELVRLPLVHAFRTYPGIIWRCVFFLGIIMACGITVKSVSQVAEQMFHPRLRHVQDATAELAAAKSKLIEIQTGEGTAKVNLDPLELDVRDAEKKVDAINAQISETNTLIANLGSAPNPREEKYSCPVQHSNGKKGKYRKTWTTKATCTRMVTDPWPAEAQYKDFTAKLDNLHAELATAQQLLSGTRDKRGVALGNVTNVAEQVAQQQSVITEKENAHMVAVADSQLHSFTGMVYGVDPRDVTDQQVYAFLRLFVFYPSIFVALASSILAMSAYTPVKRRFKDEPETHSVNLTVGEDGTVAKYVDDVIHNEFNKTRKALNVPALAANTNG